jgi:hypothetical protein
VFFAAYQYWARSAHDFHHATLGLLEGFALTILFTSLAKSYCGEYRPYYGSLAEPNSEARKAFLYASDGSRSR